MTGLEKYHGSRRMRLPALSLLSLLAACASTPEQTNSSAPTDRSRPDVEHGPHPRLGRVRGAGAGDGRARRRRSPISAEQFRLAGLEPAGENGGWTQKVPLIRTQLAKGGSASVGDERADDRRLRVPDDIYLSTVRETRAGPDRGRADGVRRLRSVGARSGGGTISRASTSRARSPSSWSTIPISRRRPAIRSPAASAARR